MEELLTTIKAVRDREDRERVFLAGINGIDMQEKQEEVLEDVADLNKSFQAKKEGFGINEGLGFMSLEG